MSMTCIVVAPTLQADRDERGAVLAISVLPAFVRLGDAWKIVWWKAAGVACFGHTLQHLGPGIRGLGRVFLWCGA